MQALTDDGLTALSALSELQVLGLRGADSLHGRGLTSLKAVSSLTVNSMALPPAPHPVFQDHPKELITGGVADQCLLQVFAP